MTKDVFDAMGYDKNGTKALCCDREAISVLLLRFCDA